MDLSDDELQRLPSRNIWSRRDWLRRFGTFGAVCALSPVKGLLAAPAPENSSLIKLSSKAVKDKGKRMGGTGCEIRLSRFMMKLDLPRLEVIAPAYRFIWHGRFPGFRLVSTVVDSYDERINYNNFGPFEVGGVDLICNQYQPFSMAWPDGKTLGMGGGQIYVPDTEKGAGDGFHRYTLEHADSQRRRLRFQFTFQDGSPRIFLTIIPERFDNPDGFVMSWAANFIYDQHWQGAAGGGYYSTGAKTGLRIYGPEPDSVKISEAAAGKKISCHIPTNKPSQWIFEVSGSGAPADDAIILKRPVAVDEPRGQLLKQVAELPSWEAGERQRRGWKAERGKVKERVAGLYVMGRGWGSGLAPLPEIQMDFISKTMLPRIAASGRFGAVGLSRDGVSEKKQNQPWLALVAQAHKAGLRVYMKPGDGELTHMRGGRPAIAEWAKNCFAVPEEQRCDVVRLPNEAVLVPWTTANLCLSPEFQTPEMAAMKGWAWPKAQERIVSSVADRFSFVIESIRRHAPEVVIDVESMDTAVLEKLLSRHDRLGVMYMCYGQYPRAAEYLDLYYCIAKRQCNASRIVMETDCYYSDSITGLGQLVGRPYAEMYSEHDLKLMQEKHRHLCSLPADAAWSWGLNIIFTEEKFKCVCEAA